MFAFDVSRVSINVIAPQSIFKRYTYFFNKMYIVNGLEIVRYQLSRKYTFYPFVKHKQTICYQIRLF